MEKVLIVDDNALFRQVVRESLHSRMPHLTIAEARDLKETMEIIETSLPDLIFMDIRLPDGNGLKITHQIKHLHPEVKVVIVTSCDEPEYREAASRSNADRFVSKDSFVSLLGDIFPNPLPTRKSNSSLPKGC